MSHSAEKDVALGWARPTIYGNYVAHAVSSRGGGAWHIQGAEPDLALCGRRLTGDLSRMDLHVSLLECSRCMLLGESHPACTRVTPPAVGDDR
jgi:hypothetical protein